MKNTALFTSFAAVTTFSCLAVAQPMAMPGAVPPAGQPIPAYVAPAPMQPVMVPNQDAVLQEMQRQLNETREEVQKMKGELDSIRDSIDHQTVGLAVGASSDLGGSDIIPMARASLKWLYVEVDSNGIGAGVQPEINLFNRLVWYPITLGAERYTGDAPYVAPEFGADRTDITFGTGASLRIWEGLRISAFVKWFVPNPYSAYSKAEQMVLEAQGDTEVDNTGVDRVDQIVEDGYNMADSKTGAGVTSAYLVNNAYDQAMRNPRIQITAEWWW